MIDCDCVDEDTQEIVDGIKHSLLRFFSRRSNKVDWTMHRQWWRGNKEGIKKSTRRGKLVVWRWISLGNMLPPQLTNCTACCSGECVR